MCLLDRQTDRQAAGENKKRSSAEEMLSWVGKEARPTQRERQQLPALTAADAPDADVLSYDYKYTHVHGLEVCPSLTCLPFLPPSLVSRCNMRGITCTPGDYGQHFVYWRNVIIPCNIRRL